MEKQVPQNDMGPKCPVCASVMTIPIYQCKSGHSVCATCTAKLMPPICPLCRQEMTQMRNWQLEALVLEVKVSCPNKPLGCTITKARNEMNKHLEECIFRNMDCPMMVLGKCSWNGRLVGMSAHFREHHPNNVIQPNDPINIDVNLKEDDRFIYLFPLHNNFIINMKINTINKIVYWSVQHIGTHHASRQHTYEIMVGPNYNHSITFADTCFNANTKADEIFAMAKCPMIPFDALKHYLQNNKLAFKVSVKKNHDQHFKHGGQSKASDNKPGPPNKFKPKPKSPCPQGKCFPSKKP